MQLVSWLPPDLLNILIIVASAIAVILVVTINALIIIYAERKLYGDMQFRYSIMRVGPHGILQLVADGLKFFLKEDMVPMKADRFLFMIAPFLFFIPVIMLFMPLPMAQNLVAINLELGIFFFFAILTVMPIALILAGWSSNSKYSLIGGLRAAAQQLSYEIPLLLAVVGVIMIANSFNFGDIVSSQKGFINIFGFKTPLPNWFVLYQPFGFLMFFIAMLADIQRPPFDLPEAESEIIAGPFTEYSGIKFFLFVFVEYTALIALAAVTVILYLGGWNGPFLPPAAWFLLKTYFVVWLIIWIRATVPRLRIDQLMNFGWKILLPLTLLNILVTGVLILRS